MDRPETFIRSVPPDMPSAYVADKKNSIGDSEDELGRMLAVLRFWFTKDLVGNSGLHKIIVSKITVTPRNT